MKRKSKKKNNQDRFNGVIKVAKVSVFLLIISLLLLVGTGIALSYIDNPMGIKAYSVVTGSMSPAINRGSLIFTKPSSTYRNGDVITFKPESGRLGGQEVDTVTHRIVNVERVEGEQLFTTRGDANPNNDYEKVPISTVVGKVFVFIPLLGFPIEFAKTEIGLVLLIIIPAVIIVYEELKNLLRGIKQYKKGDLQTA